MWDVVFESNERFDGVLGLNSIIHNCHAAKCLCWYCHSTICICNKVGSERYLIYF